VRSHSDLLCLPWHPRPRCKREEDDEGMHSLPLPSTLARGYSPFPPLWGKVRMGGEVPWFHPYDGPFSPVKMPAMPADSGTNWTAVKPCEAMRSQNSCGAGNSIMESLRY
jgi:hypothetical protein